jgi:hypothetical protein
VNGYQVTADDLGTVATAHKDQADNLRQALLQFKSVANLPASAFGNLPASGKMAAQYQKFYSQVVQDMTNLYVSELVVVAKLLLSKLNYEAAEHANTIR